MNCIRMFLILMISGFMFHSGTAQKEIRKADKQLELKAYDLAIKNYKAFLDENPENTYAQVKIAEAYRRTNQLMKAIYWYEKSVNAEDSDLDIVINYGNSLKKLGLYERAQQLFSSLSSRNSDLSVLYLKGCEAAVELLKKDDEFDIRAFDGNSTQSDYGSTVLNDQIVFSSFRSDLKRDSEKKNMSYIQASHSELFIAPRKENIDVSELKFLRSDFQQHNGIGPLAYSEDQNLVAYTKHNLSDGAISVEGVDSDLSIYLATVTESGDFSDDKAFAYNEVAYSYAFPHLAFNGSALYFSSNREGGFGGFDLYVSYYKNGKWETPENLGPEINTESNEITPFLVDDALYFASDDIFGLGGFDNYVSKVSDAKWSSPKNLGKGINSPGDDYYLSVTSSGQFTLTSNRLGGRGKDDIYFASPLGSNEIVQVPVEVDLEALALNKKELNINSSELKTAKAIADVSESEVVSKVENEIGDSESPFDENGEFKLYDNFDLDLTGAVNNTVKETEKYFIQIASLNKSKGSIKDFSKVKSLGKLYRFVMNNSTKIRLGSYVDRGEANRILNEVKRKGFGDAFITTATLNDSSVELFNGEAFVDFYGDSENTAPQYKVRLASYSDAKWFDSDELNYLDGELEQWTKGRWYIFILSGFDDYKQAESARIKAVNRGFKDAEVVVDDRGILKKLNQH